jgi:hypothetical protein
LKPYGAIHGAKTAMTMKAEAQQQHEPLEAVGLTDDGGDEPSGAQAGGGHQNLTRGSTMAMMASITTLATQTTTAMAVTMPCTARKSRALRYCVSS